MCENGHVIARRHCSSIVQYIYTGELELTVDNVESLVKGCDVLQLDALKAASKSFMLKQVERNNVFRVYRFAASYRLVNLERKARRLILYEFKTVAFTEEFKDLCTEFIVLFKDDVVDVEYEDVVFGAVLGWIRPRQPEVDHGNDLRTRPPALLFAQLPAAHSGQSWSVDGQML